MYDQIYAPHTRSPGRSSGPASRKRRELRVLRLICEQLRRDLLDVAGDDGSEPGLFGTAPEQRDLRSLRGLRLLLSVLLRVGCFSASVTTAKRADTALRFYAAPFADGGWMNGITLDGGANLQDPATAFPLPELDCQTSSPVGTSVWSAFTPGSQCSAALSIGGSLAAGRTITYDFACGNINFPGAAGGFGASGTLSYLEPACPRVRSGKEYAGLTNATKAALNRLYALLDDDGACYRLVSAFRPKTEQERLVHDWHAIADRKCGPSPPPTATVDADLRAAHFAQMFTTCDGRTAHGGPCDPATHPCRHIAGEAVDLSWAWEPVGPIVYADPTLRSLFLQRLRGFARAAGMCGPPAGDPVHIEMPYVRPPATVARCHFG